MALIIEGINFGYAGNLMLFPISLTIATEAIGSKWRNIEWYLCELELYPVINVDGKISKCTA